MINWLFVHSFWINSWILFAKESTINQTFTLWLRTFIIINIMFDCSHVMTWFWVNLTHWGRVTHICVSKLTIIGSDHGLSPVRRQAIIWIYAAILLIGHLGTNFSEFLIGIQTFSFQKMHLKMSSAKWRPFCLGLNVLRAIHASHLVYCMGGTISCQVRSSHLNIISQQISSLGVQLNGNVSSTFPFQSTVPMYGHQQWSQNYANKLCMFYK